MLFLEEALSAVNLMPMKIQPDNLNCANISSRVDTEEAKTENQNWASAFNVP